jgi:lysophospholipase L1-like esterase
MNIKYIYLILIVFGFTACSDDNITDPIPPPPMLDAGTADFSNYVAIGDSQTAGYTDGALFIAAQENSMPNILSNNMASVGGGAFTQPLTDDNIGGLLFAGNVILSNRFYFDLATFLPAILQGTPTTDVIPGLSGQFNNMGVPGAKSFHFLAPGYGNAAGVPLGLANPYFARFASSPSTTIFGDAMAQGPSFFTFWAGSLDVTSYALAGGDGVNQAGNFDPSTYGPSDITDPVVFGQAIGGMLAGLNSIGAQGVVANIANPLLLPYFAVVPYNAVPLDAGTAALLNQGFAPYNGGLLQMEAFGLITSVERILRTINFVEGQNAVTLVDEYLTDLSGFGLPSYRQATEIDLLPLTAQFIIGTTVGGNPLQINGVSVPLDDQWVLTPNEQTEVENATAAFNAIIEAAATQAGFGFVDIENIMGQLATIGVPSGDFRPTSEYVLGGALSLDGVHTNARGNALIANEFLKAIDATYGSNFVEAEALNDIGNYPTNYSSQLQ